MSNMRLIALNVFCHRRVSRFAIQVNPCWMQYHLSSSNSSPNDTRTSSDQVSQTHTRRGRAIRTGHKGGQEDQHKLDNQQNKSKVTQGWFKGKHPVKGRESKDNTRGITDKKKRESGGLKVQCVDKSDGYMKRPDHQTFFKPIQHDKGAQEMLLSQVPKQPPDPHCLKVAIIGTPNAGKSTLINSLLGRRIFSVSQKVHTTRTKSFAVLNHENKQIIILDTPGIVDYKVGRKHKLGRSLLTDPKNSLLEADLVAVLVDASDRATRKALHFDILKQLSIHSHLKSVLLLNKVDLVKPKSTLVRVTSRLTDGKIGGQSYEITKAEAAKMGSVERRTFMKLSYRPPSSVERQNKDSDNHVEKSALELESAERDECVLSKNESLPVGNMADDKSAEMANADNNDLRINEQSNQSLSELRQKSIHSYPDVSADASNTDGGIPDRYSETKPDVCDLKSSTDKMNHDDGFSAIITDEGQVEPNTKAEVMNQFVSNLKEISTARWLNKDVSPDDLVAQDVERAKRREEEKELNMRADRMQGWDGFDAVFMISAKLGDGVNDAMSYFLDQAKAGDWEYHADVITNLSPEEIVSEAIREQLLETFKEEIPYSVEQRNDFWGIGVGGELRIVQELICSKKSHVRIIERLLGKIALGAQQQLMDAFHCEVRLRLEVSVGSKNTIRRLGL